MGSRRQRNHPAEPLRTEKVDLSRQRNQNHLEAAKTMEKVAQRKRRNQLEKAKTVVTMNKVNENETNRNETKTIPTVTHIYIYKNEHHLRFKPQSHHILPHSLHYPTLPYHTLPTCIIPIKPPEYMNEYAVFFQG